MSAFTLTLKGVSDNVAAEIESLMTHIQEKFSHVEAVDHTVEEDVPTTAVEPTTEPSETPSTDGSTASDAVVVNEAPAAS